MKCLNCGAEISDGNLYCEKCGEEIHIVPVFEPELETEIDETMQRIQGDVAEQFEPATKRIRKKHHYMTWVIVLVIISILVGVLSLNYLYQSPDYQINRGNRFVDSGEYMNAIHCYEQALNNKAADTIQIYMYMAMCYDALGHEGKYEEYLLKVIRSPQADGSDLEIAYKKLISFYVQDKNYNTINSLLKSCNNDNIISIYKGFMVSAPKFSHEPGFYREIIPLKIISEEDDVIYYTLDGSTPTTESSKYNSPIFLEDGTYEIQAVCVDSNGVMSDVIFGEYQIDF